jgi:hypothetical protein
VHFATSCSAEAQPVFDHGITALHNFYFGEAKRSFQLTLETDAHCGIAYWGLATNSLGNLLVSPPGPKSITEGNEFLNKAYATGAGSPRERDYLDALSRLLTDADKIDYRTRSLAYEKAMQALYERYPQDPEAAVFYALALNITALPNDKTYANQLTGVIHLGSRLSRATRSPRSTALSHS